MSDPSSRHTGVRAALPTGRHVGLDPITWQWRASGLSPSGDSDPSRRPQSAAAASSWDSGASAGVVGQPLSRCLVHLVRLTVTHWLPQATPGCRRHLRVRCEAHPGSGGWGEA